MSDKELVDALGGVEAVRQICGFAYPSGVTNWFLPTRGGIPSAWRMVLEMKLAEKADA